MGDIGDKIGEVEEMTKAEIEKARAYADSLKDEMEDTVEDAKGFFEEHKWVVISVLIIISVSLGIALLI